MKKEIPTGAVAAIIGAIAVVVIGSFLYMAFRPEPVKYKPELLKGTRGGARGKGAPQ